MAAVRVQGAGGARSTSRMTYRLPTESCCGRKDGHLGVVVMAAAVCLEFSV